MRLKLTNAEMNALCHELGGVLTSFENRKIRGDEFQMQDKLAKALTERIWTILYKKSFNQQPKYSFELPPELTIFLYCLFSGREAYSDFSKNMLLKLCNQIHQHFA